METPPNDATLRRTTRSALAEIPSRMGAMTMNENIRETPVRANNNNNLFENQQQTGLGLLVDVQPNLPPNYLSPAPSPDELVIQQRGRRKMPPTWSPDIDLRKRDLLQVGMRDRTPVKLNMVPAGSPNSKNTIVLRSTPRKRLLLNDPMEVTSSPEKRRLLGSPNSKKSRLERAPPVFDGPVELALKGLSSEQLIGVIQTLICKHPDLEKEVKDCLPAPDMRPLEEQLSYLKKNIFKSLPNSRLTSKTDSPAYSRAATHVVAFKKCVLEQVRNLADSQQWAAVLDYVTMAWGYVHATPLWDNPPHNAARRHCFKVLAAQCMAALKRGGQFQPDFLEELHTKLQSFVADSEDIQSCMKHLDLLKKKG